MTVYLFPRQGHTVLRIVAFIKPFKYLICLVPLLPLHHQKFLLTSMYLFSKYVLESFYLNLKIHWHFHWITLNYCIHLESLDVLTMLCFIFPKLCVLFLSLWLLRKFHNLSPINCTVLFFGAIVKGIILYCVFCYKSVLFLFDNYLFNDLVWL